jgi:hypothetical protein
MLNVQDPIRNALRDLVRAKRIWAWNARETPAETEWTVVLMDGRTPKPFSTDAVNKLIAMHWAADGTP